MSTNDVPVFVMLPLDTVNANGVFQYAATPWFTKGLQFLSHSGVKGVAIDCWWGAVERTPRKYDFSAYRQACEMLRRYNLKLQVVLSFHACGSNVNDHVHIGLPAWVQECGRQDPDIWYSSPVAAPGSNARTQRNEECVSLFADDAPCLRGRTPTECYRDLMAAFAHSLSDLLGSVIVEVVIGMGPCGELRYPSYPDTQGWRFPGVGQFQSHDRRAMAKLARAAAAAGHAEWGRGPPPGVGSMNAAPHDTAFFTWEGGWRTPHGHFFLEWYSTALQQHAEALLQAAVSVLFPFLGRATQQCIVSAGVADVAGLPSEPPVRRSSSEASALDTRGAVATAGRNGSSNGATARLPARCTHNGASEDMNSSNSLADVGQRGPSCAGAAAAPRVPSGGRPASSSAGSPGEGSLRNGCVWNSDRSSVVGVSQRAAMAGTREPLRISMKLAGVHWWYHTPSHAAELTAGYYNASGRNGYSHLLRSCAAFGAGVILTCVEMNDAQHPPSAACGPQALVKQVRQAAHAHGMRIAGENALPCITSAGINMQALDLIVHNARASWPLPRRSSDVATRSIAQVHYPTSGNLPQGPGPLPASISFGPPMQRFLENGALGNSNEACMRKAASQMDLLHRPPDGSGSADSSHAPSVGGGRALRALSEAEPEAFPDDSLEGATERPRDWDAAPRGVLPPMRMFTFLRLTKDLIEPASKGHWMHFMSNMRAAASDHASP